MDMDAAVFEDDVAIITEVHCREALPNGDIVEVDSDRMMMVVVPMAGQLLLQQR